jgi:hypothetical protein
LNRAYKTILPLDTAPINSKMRRLAVNNASILAGDNLPMRKHDPAVSLPNYMTNSSWLSR